jgi:hypothetical protein
MQYSQRLTNNSAKESSSFVFSKVAILPTHKTVVGRLII